VSRAFVKESDQAAALPERPISEQTNFVTAEGMRKIDAQIHELEAARTAAKTGGDNAALAHVERDLRYWNQRRGSARVVEPKPHPDVVRFGVRVKLLFDDGTERAFRLVGEDEADPARGLVSWASPLGAALIGKAIDDEVEAMGRRAEIVALEA
jgi:transcription elongation GreA/GreB family factor